MGYSKNPDVIISQKQSLIDAQAETLELRDQFIDIQFEQVQTLLRMCRGYESTINVIMDYAKVINDPHLYTLIEESLKQGRMVEDG